MAPLAGLGDALARLESAATRLDSPRARARLRHDLVRWFERARRDLPWRRTRDPYAVWVSEAMLQQTRVETVIPYFERFLARFPDVAALAAARESEVLALWSGLGYYSRARALRAAARVLVRARGGDWPRTREEWLALPGVGPYTAGAVLSIAFGRSEALVDGNVQRVLARLFALEDTRGSRALADRCWELARALLPPVEGALDPGVWNQALMELGATVCTARAPACATCPLARACRARAAGRAEQLPRAAERAAPIEVRLEILVPVAGGRVLVLRRPAEGRMAGLDELPTRELVAGGARPRLWPPEHAPGLAPAPSAELLGTLRHAITRHRIRAGVFAGELRGAAPDGARWVRAEEVGGLPLTGLARKALASRGVRALVASAKLARGRPG
jgi:A/G-specific adenine glycosylase